MQRSHLSFAACTRLLLSSLGTHAALVTINSVTSGRSTATVGDTGFLESYRNNSLSRHGFIEFDLSSLPTGTILNSVSLEIQTYTPQNNGNSDIEVLGYVGNGLFDGTADFNAGLGNQLLAPGTITAANGAPSDINYNVAIATPFIQDLLDNGNDFLGLELIQQGTINVASVGALFHQHTSPFGPKLHIDFSTSPVPEPSTNALIGIAILVTASLLRRKRRNQ